MKQILLVYLLAVSTLLAGSEVQVRSPNGALDKEWGVFLKQHAKAYKNPAEELKRRLIWEENVDFIEKHGHSKLNESFQLKMNKFGDQTLEEFKQRHSSGKPPIPSKAQISQPKSSVQVPDSIDWRPSGCVTGPVDEGECGANWAFGVIGSIESLACLNHQNVLNVLSVQQLVDCTVDLGNYGCQGGLFKISYDYLAQSGVETNKSYPYAQRLGSCAYDKSQVKVMIRGNYRIAQGDETALTAIVGSLGPVTAGVYVTNAFRFYSSGIFYDPDCESDETDLGGLVVGYGTLGEGQRDYYIFRNNWGTDWGDDGYVYMSRGRDNNCGIATDCYYPYF